MINFILISIVILVILLVILLINNNTQKNEENFQNISFTNKQILKTNFYDIIKLLFPNINQTRLNTALKLYKLKSITIEMNNLKKNKLISPDKLFNLLNTNIINPYYNNYIETINRNNFISSYKNYIFLKNLFTTNTKLNDVIIENDTSFNQTKYNIKYVTNNNTNNTLIKINSINDLSACVQSLCYSTLQVSTLINNNYVELIELLIVKILLLINKKSINKTLVDKVSTISAKQNELKLNNYDTVMGEFLNNKFEYMGIWNDCKTKSGLNNRMIKQNGNPIYLDLKTFNYINESLNKIVGTVSNTVIDNETQNEIINFYKSKGDTFIFTNKNDPMYIKILRTILKIAINRSTVLLSKATVFGLQNGHRVYFSNSIDATNISDSMSMYNNNTNDDDLFGYNFSGGKINGCLNRLYLYVDRD